MYQSIFKVVDNMPFSTLLSSLRKQCGLTQEALAEPIGITKTQIYRYENGSS